MRWLRWLWAVLIEDRDVRLWAEIEAQPSSTKSSGGE